MKSSWKLIVPSLAAILSATQLAAQTVKVGTFDKTSITVAFYRSPVWAGVMKQKLTELEEARKVNDKNKIEELEHWGSSHQETAHKQLADEAPLTNIMEALQPAFSEIAAKGHLAVIVSGPAYTDKAVETVDITDLLLDWLKADEQTRKIIDEMRKLKRPIHLH